MKIIFVSLYALIFATFVYVNHVGCLPIYLRLRWEDLLLNHQYGLKIRFLSYLV